MISELSKTSDWHVSYSLYDDKLQVFNDALYGKKDDELLTTERNGIVLVKDSKTHNIVLVEVDPAMKYMGEVDKMSNQDILKKIKGYIKSYG